MEAWRLLFNAALSSACSQTGEAEQGAHRVSQQPQLPHPIPRYLQRDAPDAEKDRGSEQAQGQMELLVNSLPVPPHEQLGLLLRSMSCQTPPFLLGQTPPAPKTRGLVTSAGGGAEGEELSNSEEATASIREEVGSERCQRLKEKSMQKKKQRAKKSDLLRQLASLLPPPGDTPDLCCPPLTDMNRGGSDRAGHLWQDWKDSDTDLGGYQDAAPPAEGAREE